MTKTKAADKKIKTIIGKNASEHRGLQNGEKGFIAFGLEVIEEKRRTGRVSAAEHDASALNSFRRFIGKRTVRLNELSVQMMREYELYLKRSGLCANTTSFYMRRLRAIYNLAVERDLTRQQTPFEGVYTGIAKTRKRAVSLDTVKKMLDLELAAGSSEALARDMFLFSFFTRGMAIVDMAYLKRSDLRAGILTYRRRKTGQQLSIKWEPAMQRIVDANRKMDSEYMLPLIKPGGKNERRQYLSSAHLINRNLKKIGRRIGLRVPLTMYVARHTWASTAHDNNVPISLISQGMGHDSEKTTRIYLDTLDTSALDNANNFIIGLLIKPGAAINGQAPR